MIQSITVDLIPNGKMPMLHASQYDDGRQVRINLTENRQAYTLTGNEVLSLAVRKADNTLVTMDIANTYGGKSYVEFATTEQMCAVAGLNFGELTITNNGTKVGSLNFYLYCEVSPEQGGVSQSEINNLARQVEELVEEDMDDYLSKDEAADTYATLTDLDTLSGVVDTKASKTYVDEQLETKANADDVYTKSETYTKEQVDQKIADLPEPMIFKGTLGVGGTIESLPTASAENEGWTYKVITAGTYAGQTAKVGDSFTSDGSTWVLFPCGDTDTDTWRAIKVNGVEKLGNGISTGAVDFKDTTNVKFGFDAEDKSISATLDGIYTEAQVDEAIENAVYDVLPTETTTKSAIANFTTSLTKPMEFKAYIEAVQEAGTPTPQSPKAISGVSAVNVTKCGANLWDEEWELGFFDTTTGADISTNEQIRAKNKIPVMPGETYFVNSYPALWIIFYDKDENVITSGLPEGNQSASNCRSFGYTMTSYYGVTSLPIPANCYFIRFYFQRSYGTTYKNDISINYPSTDTAYHAYNGNTTTIQLGQTVYGGYVEQDKEGHRQLVDNGYKSETLLSDISWNEDGGRSGVFYGTVPSNYPARVRGSDIKCCYVFKATNPAPNTSDDLYISGKPSYSGASIFFRNSAWAGKTRAEIQSLLAGASVVYELATPTYIDLTDGKPINTLNGVNNVYADSGDIEVSFKETVNEYVDKQIASVQALILS